MPFYDYYCELCQSTCEVMKPIKDSDRPEHCPNCNNTMQKMIGMPILKFEGGGWSKDNYQKTPKTEEKKDG